MFDLKLRVNTVSGFSLEVRQKLNRYWTNLVWSNLLLSPYGSPQLELLLNDQVVFNDQHHLLFSFFTTESSFSALFLEA